MTVLQELTVENTSLRESLFNMQEQLMMLLSDQQTIVPQNFDVIFVCLCYSWFNFHKGLIA